MVFGDVINESKLTTKERNELPDEMFGIPEKRKYPLIDKEHIVMAIRYYGKTTDVNERRLLAKNIKRRIEELGLDIHISNQELVGFMNESWVFDNKDLILNIENWKKEKGKNILYITGLSGSGKTTLAEKYEREYKAHMFELDGIEYLYDSSNKKLLDRAIEENPDCKTLIEEKNWKYTDSYDKYKKIFNSVYKIMKDDYSTLYIIEGIQLFGFINIENIKNKPLVVKGTSALNSILRKFKRNGDGKIDWLSELSNEFPKLLKNYYTSEKRLRSFKRDLVKEEFFQPSGNRKEDYAFLQKQADGMNNHKEWNMSMVNLYSSFAQIGIKPDRNQKWVQILLRDVPERIKHTDELYNLDKPTVLNEKYGDIRDMLPLGNMSHEEFERISAEAKKRGVRGVNRALNPNEFGVCQQCNTYRKWTDDGTTCKCGHDHIIGIDEMINESKLTSKERSELPSEMFGIPNKRKYPIHDKTHLYHAISYFNKCKDIEDKKILAKNIKRRASELGVEIHTKNEELLSLIESTLYTLKKNYPSIHAYSTENIKKDTVMSNIAIKKNRKNTGNFFNDYDMDTLSKFIEYDDNSNLKLERNNNNTYKLIANKDIKKNTKLTVSYSDYQKYFKDEYNNFFGESSVSEDWDSNFFPSYTPKELLELGIFGGKYINSIKNKYPKEWFINAKLTDGKEPDWSLNYYGVQAGSSLEEWEEKGWINPQDPRGWFEWYCNYYMGRRTEDDSRQIKRWNQFVARHMAQIKNSCRLSDTNCRPRQRQSLLQWGWDSTTDYRVKEVKERNLKNLNVHTVTESVLNKEQNPNGFYHNNRWNSIKWINNEAFRYRVEMLIIKNDMVYLSFDGKNGSYRIPGGGTEQYASNIEQVENEVHEEARINVVNTYKTKQSYLKFYEEDDNDWMYKVFAARIYDGEATDVYIGEYAGTYLGNVFPEDLDNDMYKNGKFYKIKEVYDKLEYYHQNAIDEHFFNSDKKIHESATMIDFNKFDCGVSDIINQARNNVKEYDIQELIEKAEIKPYSNVNREIVPVYIILTATTSTAAKVIKKFTKADYNHSSISFDLDLNRIYSFGADGGSKPGFAIESKDKTYLERFGDIPCQIYSVFMRKEQADKIKSKLDEFISRKKKLDYNYLGLFGYLLNKPIRSNTRMFCSEFVDSMFKLVDIDLTNKDSGLVAPHDFAKSSSRNIYKVYTGTLSDFDKSKTKKFIQQSLANFRSTNESYDIVYEFSLYEAKEFPVQFDKEGNLLIQNIRNIDYEHEYSKCHKLLMKYDESDNYEGMKYELAKLWFMNSLLEKKIYDKKVIDKKEFIKVRARILNDFNKYLKRVNENDKEFNFTEYYNETPFSDAVYKISKHTLTGIGKLIKNIMI